MSLVGPTESSRACGAAFPLMLEPTPGHMTNIAAEPKRRERPTAHSPSEPDLRTRRKIAPSELVEWLEARLPRLCQRWLREVQNRYDEPSRGVNGLLEEFLSTLVAFLPGMVGSHRDQVEPLWLRASELFGAIAVRRGLAAGEIIEEFQILREGVIRLLYQDPPLAGHGLLSLREVLHLNRALDMGVTHASVGHTDALFFSLFEGSGIPDAPPTEGLKAEVRIQLDGLRAELREILGRVPGETDDGVAEEPQEARET